MTPEFFSFRDARPADSDTMLPFILQHGPNDWNYLPLKGLEDHFAQLAAGTVQAILAEKAERLAGFVSFCVTGDFAQYQDPGRQEAPHGYICEAVVDRAYAGQGLGTALLIRAVDRLAARGLREVYIARHAENPGSAGMMRKAGFIEIDTFDDPQRRAHGSRRTTVCRRMG